MGFRGLSAGLLLLCSCSDRVGPVIVPRPDGGPLAGRDAGVFVLTDAGPPVECGTELDRAGCSCESGRRECYTGPAANAGVGACAMGAQACEPHGEFSEWGPCIGSVAPVTEACANAADDDCDGSVDEGCEDPPPPPPPPPTPVTCAELAPLVATVTTPYPPSIPLPAACGPGGYIASNYDMAPSGATELHVVGVYEGLAENVNVRVHATAAPIVLALVAYDPVTWHVTLDPGAAISYVYTHGYHAQTVVIDGGVPVTPYDGCAYAYGWEPMHNEGGGNYHEMIAQVRRTTGLTETSYQGCYTGVSFEVPYR